MMSSAMALESIPLEMRQAKQWILWKLEGKLNTLKGTKVPYQVKNPYKKASTTDPNTWAYFGEASPTASMVNASGIGYVFTADQGIIAIDIDNHQKEGTPEYDEAERDKKTVIDLFRGKTYIEISQSGKGYHLLVKGDMPKNKLKKIAVDTGWNGLIGDKSEGGRFFAMTGNILDGCSTIATLPDELQKLYSLYADTSKEWINPNWDKQKPTEQSLSLVDELNLRVEDIGYPGNARDMGNGEIRGSHPFHGSTTGGNYAINKQKNVWICRRDGHNTGGGALELLAVRDGIILCEDVDKGCLDGKWREVFDALEKAGYDIRKILAISALRKIGVQI